MQLLTDAVGSRGAIRGGGCIGHPRGWCRDPGLQYLLVCTTGMVGGGGKASMTRIDTDTFAF